MSELEFRRLIPLSAVASLVTVGCGKIDEPSAREERAAQVTEIATEMCEKLRECDAGAFQEEFNSISECTRYYERYAEGYLDQMVEEYGRACADAYLDFVTCSVRHTTCEYDYYEVIESCEEEYESLDDKCL